MNALINEAAGSHVPDSANSTKPLHYYEISIQDHFDACESNGFDGMTIANAVNGKTILVYPVPDLAALNGLIDMIGDLNLAFYYCKKIIEPEA